MSVPSGKKKVELVIDGEKTVVEVSRHATPADLETISNQIRADRKRARASYGPLHAASDALKFGLEHKLSTRPGFTPMAGAAPSDASNVAPTLPAGVVPPPVQNAPQPTPLDVAKEFAGAGIVSQAAQLTPSQMLAKIVRMAPDTIDTPIGKFNMPAWARDAAKFYEEQDPARLISESVMGGVSQGIGTMAEAAQMGPMDREEIQKRDAVQQLLYKMGVANPDALGKMVQGGSEAFFSGLTAYQPALAGLSLGNEYAGRIDPALGEAAHAVMAPISTIAQPESDFWKGMAGVADVTALVKGTHKLAGKKAKPKEPTPGPENYYGASVVPGIDKIATMGWDKIGDLVVKLRQKKTRSKAENAALAAAENRLMSLHGELDQPNTNVKLNKTEKGADLVDAHSEAGQAELQKAIKGKGTAENVTNVTPDALIGLSKWGGRPVGFVSGQVIKGKKGEIHYEMYKKFYEDAKRKDPSADAQASMRNNKYLNARVTDDGGAIALWGSIKELHQQDISDMLLELVLAGDLKKDAKVFFAGNEKPGGLSVRDAIEGSYPRDFYAGIIPLPDFSDAKWGDLVKRVGKTAALAHKNDEGGSSTDPRTGKPVEIGKKVNKKGKEVDDTDVWAVSLWSDKYSKTVENKPEAIEAAVAEVMKKSKELMDADENVFIGTWKNADGQIVVEPSVRTGGSRAVRLARKYGQEAVFNLKTKETVDIPGKTTPNLTDDPMQRLLSGKARFENQKGEVTPDTPEALKALAGRLTGDVYEDALFEGKVGKYAAAKEVADKAGVQELSPGNSGKGAAPEEARVQRYIDTVEPAFKEALAKDREAAARGETQFSKWYSKDYYNRHLDAVEKLTDLKEPGARELYPFFESIFSVGNSPAGEVAFALTEWGKRKDGLFNTDKIAAGSKAKTAIVPNLEKLNQLIENNGGDWGKTVDWLKSEHSIAELQALSPKWTPETGRDVYYGAELFGPKIGMYGLNKSGFHKMPTIDSWMIRQWHAAMNRLSEKMGKEYNAVTKESRAAIDLESTLPGMETQLFRRAMSELGQKYGLNVTEVQALLWGLEKDFVERHGATKVDRSPHFATSERMLREQSKGTGFGEGVPDLKEAGKSPDKGTGTLGDGKGTKEFGKEAIQNKDVTSFQAVGMLPGMPDVITPETLKKLKKYAGSVNVMRLADVDEKYREKARQLSQKWADEINKVTGDKVTADEVFAMARDAEPWSKGIPRSVQVQMFGEILKLRQQVGGFMGKDALDTPAGRKAFMTLTNIANFAGRLLRFFREDVEGVEWGPRERIYRRLEKLGHDLNQVVQEGKGVNWENGNEVARFYRKFEKPEGKDILNELRYISLLSSPRTHDINFSSNLLQTTVMKPATMLAEGMTDWTLSLFNKARKRENYVAEIPAYTRGVTESVGIASKNAIDALLGKRMVEHLDLASLGRFPSMGEAKSKFWKPIAKLNEKTRYVTQALEAGDVFFRTLIEGGERAALIKKGELTGKQLTESQLTDAAAKDAAYWIFRKALDPQNKTEQGKLLSTIDQATQGFMEFSRHAPAARWLVPFVQTPMNIFKQGIEFSPLGFFTMKGAGQNRLSQFSKAAVGSMAMSGFAMAVNDLETTWSVPSDPDEKADFYAQGKLPFSVKVNGTWLQVNRLGPISYPMALVLMMKHAGKDDKVSALQSFPAAMIKFFSEQSYVQGMSSFFELMDAPDNQFVGLSSRLTSNFARQVVPLGQLQRWANNFIDRSQRIPDNMLENIARDLPGFSQRLPARKDIFGREAKKRDLGAELLQFNPLNANVEPDDPVYQFVREKKLEIGVPPSTVYGQKLTKEEHQKFIEEVGKRMYDVVERLRQEEADRKRADWEYQDAIDEYRVDITREVRETLFRDYLNERDKTRMEERKQKLKEREELQQ